MKKLIKIEEIQEPLQMYREGFISREALAEELDRIALFNAFTVSTCLQYIKGSELEFISYIEPSGYGIILLREGFTSLYSPAFNYDVSLLSRERGTYIARHGEDSFVVRLKTPIHEKNYL